MSLFDKVAIASVVAILSSVTVIGCHSTSGNSSGNAELRFSAAGSDIIPLEQRSRRKWDNAVIADLDLDGKLDIITTDHAYRANIFWNEGGYFSGPQLLIGGDTHGVAAADYDLDGKVEIVVSQGGGAGTNPRFPVGFEVNPDRTLSKRKVFDHFERSRGRAVKLVDSDNDGMLNLITSAFPLKSQPDGANFHYRQESLRQFEFIERLPFAQWLGYKVLVTDYNNDNDPDVVFYGGADMVLIEGGEGTSFTNVSQAVLGELANTHDVSSIAEIDFDNDGDFDWLLTRAKHQFTGQSYYDSEQRRFAFFSRFKPLAIDDLHIAGDFKLENLQMAFPTFDVFIGASKQPLSFDVDRHGHKDFTLSPQQAEGWPASTEQKGLYIGYLGDGIWRVFANTKSPTAAVILNVVSAPQTTDEELIPVRLFENRHGQFVDVTDAMAIDVAEQTASSAIGDFDNDGWSDIFIVRYGNMASETQQIIYRNQQGKGFKRIEGHGVISTELGATGSGAEVFDYDADGDLDLFYANERGRWHLFTNDAANNGNSYLMVEVANAPSGKAGPMGAVMTVDACGMTYRRVVGQTSAAFSHSNINQLHVGLGQCQQIGDGVVVWSNGERQQFTITDLNQRLVVGKR
ncbi:CRTAC1 family protein [Neiella sp. HB171785]|uniref:CRTAC1 family protein n=1 Tax=Neiella litorisoli TaxID=2771431 RepID=A0A8J6QUI7_9GAMM|nr:CRTAC1 family protein [Neiella litorisoli]MBD1389902.1 CRTAC1 family protein [Neiella litorisoli]